MYIPRRYEEKDRASILDHLRTHSFAILVSVMEGRPIGTHIPLLTVEEGDTLFLVGHISRGNEQKHALVEGATVLAIFPGPHAYVSPRWYTKMMVPTWNYLSVHAYGTVELMEGEALAAAVTAMVDHYEHGMPRPVHVSEIPEKSFQDDLRGIVGFRIRVTELQAVAKLSQNRDDESYHNVARELDQSGDASARDVAAEMRKRRDIS
ncbi:FMN-binding negative transcriptional regulator [Dinghuibacter silviterrae]|nr:FMN-binding negative transcriptional regulator [Dinghuibacter silviterrae]